MAPSRALAFCESDGLEFMRPTRFHHNDCDTMKAIQISRTGGPEVLEVIELPIPKPGPGEVLVKAHAIGVAYFDMLIRSGRYPWMPPLPYVLGNELSGHVVDGNGTGLQ